MSYSSTSKKVDFKTLTLEAEVPKDWRSLFDSMVKFLGSSVEPSVYLPVSLLLIY